MDLLMEVWIEQVLTYSVVALLCGLTVYFYMRTLKKKSKITEKKVAEAKEAGLFEPVSLHPYIDLNLCIGSAACVAACPEKDILGIVNGKATVINATNCIGHGACFHDCPVEAISLRIGTEKRGVELPHVNENFETNIRGIFIAGELGGMGLIKNSVEQGRQAVDCIVKAQKEKKAELDLVIVGAGPAGIAASLQATKLGLKFVTLEQDSIGGTVYTFPRPKVVMTAPMDLPLYGKIKLYNTSKDELIGLWTKVIREHDLPIIEQTKVETVKPVADGTFNVVTADGKTYHTDNVLLAIGRRGTPRKLGVPGEDLPKVAYRLLDAEYIRDKRILVVGGGDSAVESAMLLMDQNEVILSYRKDKFSRIKPKNRERIHQAIEAQKLRVIYNSNLVQIEPDIIHLKLGDGSVQTFPNDLVYIFAGGELPTKFLKNAGVEITKRFGYIVKKHK